MKQSITIAVISVILVTVGFIALTEGIARHERYECKKWQNEAKELKGYYLTDWQIEMCSTINK